MFFSALSLTLRPGRRRQAALLQILPVSQAEGTNHGAFMQEAGENLLEAESSLPNESRALNFHEACAEAITELEKLSGAEDRCLQIDDACQIMQAGFIPIKDVLYLNDGRHKI